MNNKQIFLSHLSPTLACNTKKHTQMTTENSKGIKGTSTSNVSHVSKKPLHCIYQLQIHT